MLWHMDTRSSKPCSYLLSHLLLVFNDSLAIPTASFFFLFSTYSIIAGWAGFSRQLPLLFLLLWEFKVLWLGQSVIGQMCSPVMVFTFLIYYLKSCMSLNVVLAFLPGFTHFPKRLQSSIGGSLSKFPYPTPRPVSRQTAALLPYAPPARLPLRLRHRWFSSIETDRESNCYTYFHLPFPCLSFVAIKILDKFMKGQEVKG